MFFHQDMLSAPGAPSAPSAPSAAEDKPGPRAPLLAPATDRAAHEAILTRLIEEYTRKHGREPTSNVWYRLHDQAKDEVAATRAGKRSRRASSRPGFVNIDDTV